MKSTRLSSLMAVAALAAMSSGGAAVASAERAVALDMLGGYTSRGHGGGFRYSGSDGSARVKRMARKKRNQKRHRAACKRRRQA